MPIVDNFSDYSSGLSGPICGGFDIIPSDTDEIPQVTRAIMVSQSGDLSVELSIRSVSARCFLLVLLQLESQGSFKRNPKSRSE